MEGDLNQDRLGHLFLKPQGLSQLEEGASGAANLVTFELCGSFPFSEWL